MFSEVITTYSVSYIVDEFRIVVTLRSLVDIAASDFEVLDDKSMTIAATCYVLTS
jgi:hypothetical protein